MFGRIGRTAAQAKGEAALKTARLGDSVDLLLAEPPIEPPPSLGESSAFDRYFRTIKVTDGVKLVETSPGPQVGAAALAFFTVVGLWAVGASYRSMDVPALAAAILMVGWAICVLKMFYRSNTAYILSPQGFRFRKRTSPFYQPLVEWKDCEWVSSPSGWWRQAWVRTRSGKIHVLSAPASMLSYFLRTAVSSRVPSVETGACFLAVVGYWERTPVKIERVGPFFRGAPGLQSAFLQGVTAYGAAAAMATAWVGGTATPRDWILGALGLGLVGLPCLQFAFVQIRHLREAMRLPLTAVLGEALEVIAAGQREAEVYERDAIATMGFDWPRRAFTVFLKDGSMRLLGPVPSLFSANLTSWARVGGAPIALRPDYWFWRSRGRTPRRSRWPALNPEGP